MRSRLLLVLLIGVISAHAQSSADDALNSFRRTLHVSRAVTNEDKVFVLAELEGRPLQLVCVVSDSCNAPRPGNYWMVNLQPSGCARVALLEETYRGNQEVGQYCDSDLALLPLAAPLMAEWRDYPTLQENALRGSVVVGNQTRDDFDETVIVEAINEIGKAFAVGYQHFTLRANSRSVPIDFNTKLPPGHYLIHVDVIGEVPNRHAIHRVYLEAAHQMVVTVI